MRPPFTCVYREIWDEERFWDLSDSGKLVYFYTLTTTLGNGLGCFKAGIGAMVEESRMLEETFKEGFQQCLKAGFFEYDEYYRVLFLPNYLKRNAPMNPNGLMAIGKDFVKIPDSMLKVKCYQSVKNWVDSKGDKFMEAFVITFGQEPGNVPGNVTGNVPVNDLETYSQSQSNSKSDRYISNNNDITVKQEQIVTVPESNYDRSSLKPISRKLGDILYTYFAHLGQFQCDDWAVRLNSEFGKHLDLPALFTEMGKTYEGNQKKVVPGKEWGHFRLWCRNAMMGGKEFQLESKNGEKVNQGVDIFKSKSGRQRFVGLFKEAGKTIEECVETASEDGSVPGSMILQWQKDLEEYEQELKEAGGGE